ncbi:unnamed protein product [Chrysoparadoxa australica]
MNEDWEAIAKRKWEEAKQKWGEAKQSGVGAVSGLSNMADDNVRAVRTAGLALMALSLGGIGLKGYQSIFMGFRGIRGVPESYLPPRRRTLHCRIHLVSTRVTQATGHESSASGLGQGDEANGELGDVILYGQHVPLARKLLRLPPEEIQSEDDLLVMRLLGVQAVTGKEGSGFIKDQVFARSVVGVNLMDMEQESDLGVVNVYINRGFLRRRVSLAAELLGSGGGRVRGEDIEAAARDMVQLEKAEEKARRKGLGIWKGKEVGKLARGKKLAGNLWDWVNWIRGHT